MNFTWVCRNFTDDESPISVERKSNFLFGFDVAKILKNIGSDDWQKIMRIEQMAMKQVTINLNFKIRHLISQVLKSWPHYQNGKHETFAKKT
jgi:hypothetical protein